MTQQFLKSPNKPENGRLDDGIVGGIVHSTCCTVASPISNNDPLRDVFIHLEY